MKFREISFAEMVKSLTEKSSVKESLKRLHYFWPMLAYGLTLIFLLKISQLVLSWHF